MNSITNYNERVAKMKEIRVDTIDVKDRVMDKIYSLSNKKIETNKRYRFVFRGMPVWAALLLTIFLITSVSVSAAVMLNWNWNGIQLTIANTAEKSLSPESKISLKERIQKELLENSDVWKKVPLIEAEKSLLYTPLRPNEHYTVMKQTDSFGILNRFINYRVKSQNEVWWGGVYDIYERDKQYVVVRQNLDELMTGSLLNPDIKMSMTYLGSAEKIQSSDQMLIIYRKGDLENELLVSYKSANNKVISLELTGSEKVTKEELIDLAKAYTGN